MLDKPNRKVYDTTMKKPNKKQRSLYASYLGSIKSDRKAKSSRENGKKGGRPRKDKVVEASVVYVEGVGKASVY